MQHLEALARRFSTNNLIGCALKVATILENDGSIVQLNPLQDFAYGELDGKTTARIKALDRFMQGASIGARLSPVIHREMWEKWILLAGLGAITCLMRGTVGEIEATEGGTSFVMNLLAEIVAIVAAVGETPSTDFVKEAQQQLTRKGSPLASSMFRDLLSGRDVEVEQILGDLICRGEQVGLKAPLLSAAAVHLRVYRNKIAASR
ncbi:ketopantoate reductase C-terminal domain-containing protein [Cupriavidus necator]|uniref:ketopantoate reductase C-terminal domain-containing protein n=1 Tax=Cupriavidus necator TaxID=106590 RepID=UPI0039C1A824